MKILIADDEEPIRRLLTRMLSKQGYEVIDCGDGETVLQAAVANRPDLILTDLEMPGVSGVEVIRRLRADPAVRDIPVLVLTGNATKENVLASLGSGAADFIVKGDLRIDELLARVQRALKSAPERKPSSPPPAPPPSPPPRKPAAAEEKPARKKGTILTREQIESHLKDSVELKALPFIVAEVIKVTSSTTSDSNLLTQTVARDPAVAARVLQMANSAFFVPGGGFQHLAQAVARLGFRQVREITIALKLMEEFRAGGKKSGLDRLEFWKHALACAVLSRDIASAARTKPEEAEVAFLAGLLHDIGQTFLMDHFPTAYARVMALAAKQGRPLQEIEEEACGETHTVISRRILTKWKLLEEFLDPITAHHRPSSAWEAPQGESRLPGIVWLANVLAKAVQIGSDGDETLETVPDGLVTHLGLDGSKLASILEGVQGHVNQLAEILLLHGQPPAVRAEPGPLAEGVSCALVFQTAPLLDPVEILLGRSKWETRRSVSLGEAAVDGGTGAVIVRARTEAWLREQVLQAVEAGGKEAKGTRPLVVFLDGEMPKDLKSSLKGLGAEVLGSPVFLPKLMKVLSTARRR
ncbi:MAG TPA: response regulator [Planctomycetota bacterium]|nr:response regulator [Planctomycetota bacterium]